METNERLDIARRIVEHTGSSLFLTGKAGTGKTTFLRNLRNSTRKRIVVAAPYGHCRHQCRRRDAALFLSA